MILLLHITTRQLKKNSQDYLAKMSITFVKLDKYLRELDFSLRSYEGEEEFTADSLDLNKKALLQSQSSFVTIQAFYQEFQKIRRNFYRQNFLLIIYAIFVLASLLVFSFKL